MEDSTFYLLVVFHIAVWLFVMLAFMNKRTAYINMYYLIPGIYILHILPFHILSEAKRNIFKNWRKREKETHENMIIPKLFNDTKKYLDGYTTFNPISPQGMLIFGMISCVYSLYPIDIKSDISALKGIVLKN
jgi:hypothetical protein